jgi:hypothetical protein
MCHNCGCEMPDNGQSAEEAKKNALALLQKSLGRTR